MSHPSWRATSIAVYRLWHDLGYAVGALLAGLTANLLGLQGAMAIVAALTCALGKSTAARMSDAHPKLTIRGGYL